MPKKSKQQGELHIPTVNIKHPKKLVDKCRDILICKDPRLKHLKGKQAKK